MKRFKHVIVGTGQATGTLIGGLPEGESVAVIEGSEVGGTCVNIGCTPTKTLVASAKVAHMARRAADYGVTAGEVSVDFAKVMARMNAVRGSSRNGLETYLESLAHVTLLRGWAQFEDANTLRVGDARIRGETIYLNVGARASVPESPGLDEVDWLDNRRILELAALPEHLVVLGGSYIGLEFGQMFRRFGSQVTVVQRGERIMTREDEDVSAAAMRILEAEGLHFELDADLTRVEKTGSGVKLYLAGGRTVEGSHLLLATGRVPNSDTLKLEAAGIETDARGYIEVDDHCRTSAPGVYALGDVNGQGAFTHTSVNDAEIVLDLYRGGTRTLSARIPTYAMFIDPPLGRVGMTEREALDKGYKVLKATRKMSTIARAKEMGETEGFVKLLVDAESDLILGASILGVHGDEVINMFGAYMYSGLPCRHFRQAVLVHPTVSELMPWILDGLEPVN